MSTRFLPRAWYVEYLLQLAIKLNFHERYKNYCVRRQPLNTNKREISERSRKYSQYRAEKISKWTKDNNFRFNDQKSKLILMTLRKRKERKDLEVYLNNKILRQVNTMKYLGIIIDNKLTFSEYITHMSEKCTKIIFALSKSAKLNWGLSHKTL